MSGPRVTLMVAGIETDVFVRLHCCACDGRVSKEFALTGQVMGAAQAITVAVTEPVDVRSSGWFVYDGQWYCPLHEISVVPRRPPPPPPPPIEIDELPTMGASFEFVQQAPPRSRGRA